MPFRPAFDCLWCGRPWRASGKADLTGWASLCPDCLDRAQDNSFLRFRLRSALRERSGGSTAPVQTPSAAAPAGAVPAPAPAVERRIGETRAPESDDWYMRRGRYSRGAARDLAWHAELDAVTTWLDGLPFEGTIVELAAGAGWWSPLLASKGDLSLYDASEELLDRARDRLVAHRLRAHIHVRDAWQEPDRPVDGVFCGFWLGQVQDRRLDRFLGLVGRWLRPGGRFAFVESLPDPEAGPADATPDAQGMTDGTTYRSAEAYADALRRSGFAEPVVAVSGRFFVMGTAVGPG